MSCRGHYNHKTQIFYIFFDINVKQMFTVLVHYCQVGYGVSNLQVQVQLDFINTINILQGKFCILRIYIAPGTLNCQNLTFQSTFLAV